MTSGSCIRDHLKDGAFPDICDFVQGNEAFGGGIAYGRLQVKWVRGLGKTEKSFTSRESFQGAGDGIEEVLVLDNRSRGNLGEVGALGEPEAEKAVGVSTKPFSLEA